MKSLEDISWKVSEEEYRADPSLSYSILAKYEREGFSSIPTLFDKIETPSLTLGSAIDSIITGGQEEFESRFLVADFPSTSSTVIGIIKQLFSSYNEEYSSLKDIPDSICLSILEVNNYQPNWKPETRVKVLKEKGLEYYNLLYVAGDKTILDTDTYQTVCNMVDSLKTSKSTEWYFAPDNPFDKVRRYYQLKFKDTFGGISYKCMADLLVVDYDKKIIYPCDLKSSGKPEYDFYKSFIQWNYQLQSRLYWRLIRRTLDKDDYFKDFELAPYRFIVINRDLNPLVWIFNSTAAMGELRYGRLKNTVFRDPYTIGMELNSILTSNKKNPIGIAENGDNDLIKWIDKNCN